MPVNPPRELFLPRGRIGPPAEAQGRERCARMVASIINHSVSASIRRTSNIVCHRPALLQRLKREKTLFQDPNSPGKSLQGAPVRCFQRMASIMFGWFFGGRPVFPRSGGSKGANLSHM